MPISIILLYALVISAFIADQLSSFMDAHWKIAEFSFRDPWHVGITIFWGAVIIWVMYCIRRKDPSTPQAFLCLGLVTLAFLIFEVLDVEQAASVVVYSFQTLEVLIWFGCYAMCLYSKVLKSWFLPADHTDPLAELDAEMRDQDTSESERRSR